jgi:hypothetical protein
MLAGEEATLDFSLLPRPHKDTRLNFRHLFSPLRTVLPYTYWHTSSVSTVSNVKRVPVQASLAPAGIQPSVETNGKPT